ncbi:hypothetical protein ATN83_1009 [Raoultella ornithinolytica]|nr:hypothetical protein ATN83_1009 [Raoultella ornithinolytica]
MANRFSSHADPLSDGERVLRVFYPRTSLIFPRVLSGEGK